MASERKAASASTIAAQQAVKDRLAFDDTRDFESAQHGFIAPLPDDGVIKDENGKVVFDKPAFAVAQPGVDAPDTVNPSLWRQTQVMHYGGLFEVVKDGVYQVRGTDLTNITFIEAPEGLIILDPLTAAETAAVSLKLYREHRGDKPVVGVIYTHCHIDHYGGVRGVVDEADVKSGKVKILAPEGFMDNLVDEMLMGGNAMSRRSSYQYGEIVGPGPDGIVTSGLGLAVADGTVTLIPPTDIIDPTNLTATVGGLDLQFMMAQDSEAPSEMFVYIPSMKALCPAEDACHTQHNVYTLRGAKVRDALAWSKYLKEVRRTFSDAEFYFAPHLWPDFGRDAVQERLAAQSAMYKFLHDQTMRLANQGATMIEAAEQVHLPEALAKRWDCRGYYGTTSHNVKAIWNFYLGWYDGNPSHLHHLPEAETAKRYVEYMGGAENILAKAKADFDKGDYRWVAEVLDRLVFADPDNAEAKDLLADTLEQLGYQAEAGTWRGWYLTGAHELRHGVQRQSITNSQSIDTVRNTPTGLLFNFLAIHVNAAKAEGKKAVINLDLTDVNEKYALILEHCVLDYEEDLQVDDADLTISLTRESLNAVLAEGKSLEDLEKEGKAITTGDVGALATLGSAMDTFDLWFPIVTP